MSRSEEEWNRRLRLVLGDIPVTHMNVLPPLIKATGNCPYKFMYHEHYLRHARGDTYCILWLENLLRIHLASATSLRRHYRWLRACRLNSVIEPNYLAFAASLRGLLESGGDVLHSLLPVPKFLAQHKLKIQEALSGKLHSDPAPSQKLEDALIHHSFATKQSRTSPESPHKAEDIQRYLSAFPNSEKIKEIYAILCDLTHPGMLSLNWLVAEGSDETDVRWRIVGDEADGEAIQTLCRNHVEDLSYVQELSVNQCVYCLRMLKEFPLDNLHTDLPLDKLGLANSPYWNELKGLMAAPQNLN